MKTISPRIRQRLIELLLLAAVIAGVAAAAPFVTLRRTPGAVTANTVPRFDGTSGELVKTSGLTIDDSNVVTGVTLGDELVTAAGSATNYTPGAATVEGHLSGIDTAVGALLTGKTGFFSGSGAPSDGNGANGDWYWRNSDGSMYLKAGGTWGSPVAYLAFNPEIATAEFAASTDRDSFKIIAANDDRVPIRNLGGGTPGANDDESLGYSVGSLWLEGGGMWHICMDATDGAAVWEAFAPGRFTPSSTDTVSNKTMSGSNNTFSNLPGNSEAYDATGWDGDGGAPTKNDVRDKIEAVIATIPTLSKTIAILLPKDADPGTATTTAGVYTKRNGIPVIEFDPDTDWTTEWVFRIPNGIDLSGGCNVIVSSFSAATSGNVRHAVQFDRLNGDVDSATYDTPSLANGAVNGTSGIVTHTTIAVAAADLDGAVAGDYVRLQYYRDANDGTNDTAAGVSQVVGVEVQLP